MPENTSKQLERDENGRLLPGQESLNPNGRPKGSLNFATKFKEAIEKLAETDELSGDELELQIIQMGIKKARDGDYSFYRDTLDRVYGKPQQSIDHTSGGKEMPTPILANAYELQSDNSNTQGDEPEQENTSSAGGNVSEQDNQHTSVLDTLGTD